MKYATSFLICLISICLFSCPPIFAKDLKGCSDHPMVSRYAGSEIVRCTTDKFNEYQLLVKKAVRYGGIAKNLDAAEKIEGKVTRITYSTPKERSTLEVFKNYEGALKEGGFTILFSCSNKDCGGRNFNHAVVSQTREFGENYRDQRYLAARLKRAEGDVTVSLYVVRNTSGGGPARNLLFTQLDVVEGRPMEAGMVTIDASAMAEEISKTGRVALYGIYFDTDKAEVKPESKPTLEEIAKLLKKHTSLELVIVGHTDNQGAFDYNMNLSKRRAKAVVDSLVKEYGIKGSRLQHWGVGYLSPVASNKSETGRAKNRRVELVER